MRRRPTPLRAGMAFLNTSAGVASTVWLCGAEPVRAGCVRRFAGTLPNGRRECHGPAVLPTGRGTANACIDGRGQRVANVTSFGGSAPSGRSQNSGEVGDRMAAEIATANPGQGRAPGQRRVARARRPTSAFAPHLREQDHVADRGRSVSSITSRFDADATTAGGGRPCSSARM